MKKFTLTFATLLVAIFTLFTSCKKDKYGNTDINYSNTVTLNNFSSYYDDGNNFIYQSTIDWDKITQTVIDNGIVMVYAQLYGEWYALPYTETGQGYAFTYNYFIKLNKVVVEINGFNDNSSQGTGYFNGNKFRVVVLDKHQIKSHPEVNLQDYNEVKKAFNL